MGLYIFPRFYGTFEPKWVTSKVMLFPTMYEVQRRKLISCRFIWYLVVTTLYGTGEAWIALSHVNIQGSGALQKIFARWKLEEDRSWGVAGP